MNETLQQIAAILTLAGLLASLGLAGFLLVEWVLL